MRPAVFLVLFAGLIQADLTCFEWGLISIVGGLFCHFRPEAFNAVQSGTRDAVADFADQVKDVLEFDVTHHPATIAYEYTKKSNADGAQVANGLIQGKLQDGVNVTIGVGKELANLSVTILAFADWNDVSFCIMTGALKAAHTAKSVHRRAGIANQGTSMNQDTGMQVVSRCMTDKFRRLANPAVFNITDSNQRIGANIADVASSFVPIGVEQDASRLAYGAYDLAIPGGEDAARIYKATGANQGQHFANEVEALTVRDNLKNPEWTDANCAACGSPSSPLETIATSRRKQRARRGAGQSFCCRLGARKAQQAAETIEGVPDSQDSNAAQSTEATLIDDLSGPEALTTIHDLSGPEALTDIGESLVVPWQWDYGIHDTNPVSRAPSWRDPFLNDLRRTGIAVVKSESRAYSGRISMTEALSLLRTAFANPRGPKGMTGSRIFLPFLRDASADSPWGLYRDVSRVWKHYAISTDDLNKLQSFSESAVTQAKELAKDLREMSPAEAEDLVASITFGHQSPDPAFVSVPSLRRSASLLQLQAADQPGLVVRDPQSFLHRPPVAEDTWRVLKGVDWMETGTSVPDATSYAEFGPEIVGHGRVSIKVNVWKNGASSSGPSILETTAIAGPWAIERSRGSWAMKKQ